jgi:hypothetical protein
MKISYTTADGTSKSKPWKRPVTASRRRRLRTLRLARRRTDKHWINQMLINEGVQSYPPVIFVEHRLHSSNELCHHCHQPIREAHIYHNGYWHLDCAEKEAARRGERWM